jgi:tetratricopeptide repeat domain protein
VNLEGFYLDEKDPIFGIIIFIGILLLISVLSYIWGIFAKKDEQNKIENFIKKFNEFGGLEEKYIEILDSIDDIEIYGVLAEIFTKNGDFSKAINVYLIALKNVKSRKQKEQILTRLGMTYFKAGFLARADETLLRALELSPRNEKALAILSVIYEQLRAFKKELEVLDALRELGSDVKDAEIYAKIKIIWLNNSLNKSEKIAQILPFCTIFQPAKRIVLEIYLNDYLDENLDELLLNLPDIRDFIDLLWYHADFFAKLNLEQINKQILEQIRAVLSAKFVENSDEEVQISNQQSQIFKSDFFEINALNSMKNSGFNSADLSFKYVCKHCKNVFPSYFYRCPVCYELKSCLISPQIMEKEDEISQTF